MVVREHRVFRRICFRPRCPEASERPVVVTGAPGEDLPSAAAEGWIADSGEAFAVRMRYGIPPLELSCSIAVAGFIEQVPADRAPRSSICLASDRATRRPSSCSRKFSPSVQQETAQQRSRLGYSPVRRSLPAVQTPASQR